LVPPMDVTTVHVDDAVPIEKKRAALHRSCPNAYFFTGKATSRLAGKLTRNFVDSCNAFVPALLNRFL
jgi:hypothetical protein